MIGLAVTLVGFGGQRSQLYIDACYKTAKVVGKYSSYPMLSFVQIPKEELFVVDTKGQVPIVDAVKKEVALPPLSDLVANWKIILQELSADLEEVIVTILVNGVTEVAIDGNII